MKFESIVWDVHPVSGMTRADRSYLGRSYRAALLAPIAHRAPALSALTTALAEEAAYELARFDADLGHELAPYAAILLRSEAASSSRIEGITAGARAVMEAEVTGAGRGNAAEVFANTLAMRRALSLGGPLDETAILSMHEALLSAQAPEIAGRWRTDQVWVGSGSIPHTADFVPPIAGRVGGYMADLVDFIRRDDLPVIVMAAIVHAQFETIHPFPDGNGRVGRALMHALLRAKGLVTNASVPVSAGLLVARAAYIDALGDYRDGDPGPIVAAVARACVSAVSHGRSLVARTRDVRARWANELGQVRSDSAVHRLADGLIGQPAVTVHQARQILGTQVNVHRHIDVLVEHGILTPHQDYRTRNMTWRAQDVLDALDEYSAEVGRRQRSGRR